MWKSLRERWNARNTSAPVDPKSLKPGDEVLVRMTVRRDHNGLVLRTRIGGLVALDLQSIVSVGRVIQIDPKVKRLIGALEFYRDQWMKPAAGSNESPQATVYLEIDAGERGRRALTDADEGADHGR